MTEVTPRFKGPSGGRGEALYKEQREWIVENRSHGSCEVSIRGVCTVRATMFHHKKTRRRGGCDYAHNLLHLCAHCHEWIHKHPEASLSLEWLVSQWDTHCEGQHE